MERVTWDVNESRRERGKNGKMEALKTTSPKHFHQPAERHEKSGERKIIQKHEQNWHQRITRLLVIVSRSKQSIFFYFCEKWTLEFGQPLDNKKKKKKLKET